MTRYFSSTTQHHSLTHFCELKSSGNLSHFPSDSVNSVLQISHRCWLQSTSIEFVTFKKQDHHIIEDPYRG
ncbi:hypothetical protein EUGRSUZ_C00257 [Eucalyptus grandis]|uniref:Uncharacterized protein n=2 Tax=Eucalyptus grandis TaxID=71139 RepID=A0ACC3L9N3_EUCGR|nr:hypothetical protein EUGRSUZ_C00257 [Eucalyptus grandis]